MSRTNLKTATLEQLEDECMELMGTPYGHNMIGIICQTEKGQELWEWMYMEKIQNRTNH